MCVLVNLDFFSNESNYIAKKIACNLQFARLRFARLSLTTR